jgi:hypothetical protein
MSKTDTVNKWLTLAQFLAPAVLMAVPHGDKIAPFVPVITSGIQEAEQIPGASGPEKKAHVMNLAMAAFQTLQRSGKVHLDVGQFQSVIGAGIDATVGTIDLVHQAHVPAGVLLPPVGTTGE